MTMTEKQIFVLVVAEKLLTEIYWDMIDNKQDKKQVNRLKTILYRLDALKKLNVTE